jgi:hypothetical protein
MSGSNAEPSSVGFALVLITASLCVGCGAPGPDSVKALLQENEKSYRSFVETWASRSSPRTACHFTDSWLIPGDDEGFRWDETVVLRSGTGYEVTTAGAVTHVQNLEAAVTLAKINPVDLSAFTDAANRLHIYCIENQPNGYVELMLHGSDKSPYGVRYVITKNSDTFTWMTQRSGEPLELEDNHFEHLFGRWFYFRAKR